MSIGEFIKETRGELKHVNWPTRRQAVYYTILVIGVSVLVSAYLGIFDSIFTFLLKLVI